MGSIALKNNSIKGISLCIPNKKLKTQEFIQIWLVATHTLSFLLVARTCGGMSEDSSHNGLVRAE